MGPRSIDRGIEAHDSCPTCESGLQWGRDQLIAEFKEGLVNAQENAKLQWGRDQLIAELNGTVLRERKALLLQWGRDQLIAELGQAPAAARRSSCFNGAAIN